MPVARTRRHFRRTFCNAVGLSQPDVYSNLALNAASQFGAKIAGALSDKFTKPADVVMALTPSDSVLAQEVARARVRAIFASRDDNGEMVLKHNFTVKEGENVLIVDDVAVSGRKINKAIDLVGKLGGNVIGVGVIVDRSMGCCPCLCRFARFCLTRCRLLRQRNARYVRLNCQLLR